MSSTKFRTYCGNICSNCEKLKKKVRDEVSIGEYRDEFREFLCGVCYFDALEEMDRKKHSE